MTLNDIWIEYDESNPNKKCFRIKFSKFEQGFSYQWICFLDNDAKYTFDNTMQNIKTYNNDNMIINSFPSALKRCHDQNKKVTIEISIKQTEEEKINHNRKIKLDYILYDIPIKPNKKIYSFDFKTKILKHEKYNSEHL